MAERHDVLITLGSNIEPQHNIPEAMRAIGRHPGVELRRCSRVYETEPVGEDAGQAPFHNAAALVSTDLTPAGLRAALREIETGQGRVRTGQRNAPRTIDLDIAYFGDLEIEVDGTPIPDPDVPLHLHLARPLADVAPDWTDPATGSTLAELVAKLTAERMEVHPMSTQLVPFDTEGRYAGELEPVADEVYAPHFEGLVRGMLLELGEDPDREGLRRTPLRVAKAMDFLTSGYGRTLDDVVNEAIFDEGFEEMVVVKDIEFYSLCEHHMLPFVGKAAVGYLPQGRIIGLSKIARIVDLYARRLQVQERLTNQVADALMEVLEPHGVAVVMEGKHFCMMMRGVQKQESSMVTSAMRGTFNENARSRSEFLELIRSRPGM
jgi:GTP cyclohydrolase I